jgi:hypothetical protein
MRVALMFLASVFVAPMFIAPLFIAHELGKGILAAKFL